MARKKTPAVAAPEWSFPVDADKISSKATRLTIKPSPEVKALLAQRLNILGIKSLNADLSFQRHTGQAAVHVTGELDAVVKQACVVSGKPVEEEVKEKFQAWFADNSKTASIAKARHDKELTKGNAEMPVLDESEDPEPIIDGKIDAGELVVQYLSLAINPYPHAEGVKYELGDEPGNKSQKRMDNPFAALKQWKKDKSKD